MTEYPNSGKGALLPLTELRLADCVEIFDGPYGTGIVKKIADGQVTFFRPYGTHTNFSCGNAVICYTGVEEFSRAITPRETIKVWRRESVR